jgi:hypothetical protein
VLRTVEEGIREVSDAAGSQHERAPQADTQRAARGADEDGAGDRIPENVSEIGVEGERRQRTPRLSVEDPLGVGAPALEPVRAEVARTRDGEEGQQQSGDRQARGEVDRRRLLLPIWRRRRVLAFVGGERRGGSFGLLRGNLEREAATGARDLGVESFGRKDEGPFVGDPPDRGDPNEQLRPSSLQERPRTTLVSRTSWRSKMPAVT